MVTPAEVLLMVAVVAHAGCSLLPTPGHRDSASPHHSRVGGDGWVLRAARPEQRRGGVVSVRLWWRPPEPPPAGQRASAFLVTWEVAGGALRGNLVTDARCATLSLQPHTVFHVQVSVLHGTTVSSSHPLMVDTGRALQLHLRLHHRMEAVSDAGGGSSWPGAVQLAPPTAHTPTPATLAAVAAAALLAALGVVFASLRCLSSSCRRPKRADPWPTHAGDVHSELCAQPTSAPQGMPQQAVNTVPENDRKERPVPTQPATATSSRELQSTSGVSWLPVVELNMSTDWLNTF